MDREDTIEKEQAGEERARTQVLRAQETGTNYESTMETLRQAEQELPSFSGSYDDADLVIVNTCGFIDAAVEESLQAIGEALAENDKVIVTGCLGARPQRILEEFPQVLAITGPHAEAEVLDLVHRHLPKPHDPFTDLVPPQGLRLTPPHYAYL